MERYTLSLFSTSANPAHNKTVENVVSLTWDELAPQLLTRNWSPAVYANGTRNLANYKGHPHLFAFDIDGDMTLIQAQAAFKDYQCLIQTSRNHQKVKNPGTSSEKPACDRFRIVFVLAEPIDTNEDFKATFEAYSDLYPLDPQTNNASGYFFRHLDTVVNQPTGRKLAVIRSSQWNEAKASTYSFTKDESNPTRGKISAMSREFLAHGAPSGMFNLRLFKCAVDHLEQRFYEHEFLDACARAATANVFQPLDDHDLATVRSAYSREPKYGIRAAGSSYVEIQMQEITNRIMEGEFIQCLQHDMTVLYRIKDYENKEVEMIQNNQIVDRHIDTELKKPENYFVTTAKDTQGKMHNVTKKMTVKQIRERWALGGDAITQLPEPFLWRGVEGWCHKRFEADFSPGQPHPAWDEFTSRLSDPEVFKAWVFSCFVPNHETRQALWLLGKNGEDGKTRITETIASFFGNAAGVVSGGQLVNERFALSQFVGKRLAIYPDCKHTKFPQTELFRNLTGGDLVGIELKGRGFIQQVLKAKVLVASNYEPETSSANYDSSRMIVIDVAESLTKNDPQWPIQLKEQMMAFLGDAQISFQNLCRKNGKIDTTDAIQGRLADCAQEVDLENESLFQAYFKIKENAPAEECVKGVELMNLILAARIPSPSWKARSFRIYLENQYKIAKVRYPRGFHFKDLVFRDPATKDRHASGVL